MTAFLTNWLWQGLWVAPLLLAIASLPVWPWSRRWGLLPTIGLALLAGLVLLLHVNYMV